MAQAVGLLDGGVVGVLVANKEGSLDIAAIGIFALAIEHLLVQLNVVVVDGIVEGDGDHLRDVLGLKVAGDGGAVLRAEAVGQNADGWVTGRSAVGIVFDICESEESYD